MKNLLKKMGLLCTVLCWSVASFAQGVDFRDLSLDDALKASAQENKLVFMDCYTSWCGPCKMMSNTVFTQKAAGDYFNPQFVCIKVDMEKGEGPSIKAKYNVSAFPTFLILNSDGTLKHQMVGAAPLEPFIEKLKLGLNSMRVEEMDALYKEGKLSKDQQMKYWNLLTVTGDVVKAATVGDNLWKSLSEKEKLTANYWPLLQAKAISLDSDEAKLALANRATLEKEVGTEEYSTFMYNTLYAELQKAVVYQLPAKKYEKIPAIRSMIEEYNVPRKEALLVVADLAAARGRYDNMGYLDILDKNLSVLNDEEKRTMFEGAKLMSCRAEQKCDYGTRLGEVGFRAIAKMDDSFSKEAIRSIAYTHRRMGSNAIYWDDFKSLEGALEEAELEGKYVALFLYQEGQTLSMISQKPFADAKVVEMFNRSFVNYKLNLADATARRIAKLYSVKAPNTLLFIDKNGDVRHRISNLMINNLAERAIDVYNEHKALGFLEAKYEGGDKSVEVVKDYLQALQLCDPNDTKATDVAYEMFKTLNDEQRLSKEYWMLFNTWAPLQNEEISNYLLDNIQRFRAVEGDELVTHTVESYIYIKLKNDLYNVSNDRVAKFQSFLKKEKFEKRDMLMSFSQLIDLHAKKEGNVKLYKKAAQNMLPNQIPFADLFMDAVVWYPDRREEWIGWGKELVKQIKNPDLVIWYNKVMGLQD